MIVDSIVFLAQYRLGNCCILHDTLVITIHKCRTIYWRWYMAGSQLMIAYTRKTKPLSHNAQHYAIIGPKQVYTSPPMQTSETARDVHQDNEVLRGRWRNFGVHRGHKHNKTGTGERVSNNNLESRAHRTTQTQQMDPGSNKNWMASTIFWTHSQIPSNSYGS
jgi:hypothetical protein